MAVQILNIAQLDATEDPDTGAWIPLVRVELEYEDTTNILSLVRVINNGQAQVLVAVRRSSDGREVSRTFGPGTTTQSLPQNTSQRVNFVPAPGGKWSGFSCSVTYPAP